MVHIASFPRRSSLSFSLYSSTGSPRRIGGHARAHTPLIGAHLGLIGFTHLRLQSALCRLGPGSSTAGTAQDEGDANREYRTQ